MGKKADNPESNNPSSGAEEEEEEEYAVEKILDRRVRKGKVCITLHGIENCEIICSLQYTFLGGILSKVEGVSRD